MIRLLIYGFFLVFAYPAFSQTRTRDLIQDRVDYYSIAGQLDREAQAESRERELSNLRLEQMHDEAKARKIQLRAKAAAYNEMIKEKNDGEAFLKELISIDATTPDYPIKEAELFSKYPLAVRCRIGIEYVLDAKRETYRYFAKQKQLPVPDESSFVQLPNTEDFHRERNALLSESLTGSSSDYRSIEEMQKQTKLLMEQKNALESQILIMQQNANKR